MKGLPAWESVGFRPNLSVLKRVRQVADSRVVAGVHYTSDTEAGLPWATCSSHRSKHSLGFRRTWMLAMMANITTLMTSPCSSSCIGQRRRPLPTKILLPPMLEPSLRLNQ
jgi:hypothetical protein